MFSTDFTKFSLHLSPKFSPRFLAQDLRDLGPILQTGAPQNLQEDVEGRQVLVSTGAAAMALLGRWPWPDHGLAMAKYGEIWRDMAHIDIEIDKKMKMFQTIFTCKLAKYQE